MPSMGLTSPVASCQIHRNTPWSVFTIILLHKGQSCRHCPEITGGHQAPGMHTSSSASPQDKRHFLL